jgi:hypothetical protein
MPRRVAAPLLIIAALSPAMAQPSGPTTFQLEDKNGKAVAVFAFESKQHRYDGVLFCQQGHRFLTLMDRDDAVPPVLRTMIGFPAEFVANGRAMGGSATYAARTGVFPSMVFFSVPLLDHRSFAGSGFSLATIANPRLSSAEAAPRDRAAWADAVTAFRFRITATNGEQTLPSVLGGCPRP